jgi:acetyl-CoA C-acetyltransferase
MTAQKAQALRLKPLARIASYATVALDPSIIGMGPVPASQKALQRAGWQPQDRDLLEINEAFAAQACAVNNEMGWDTSKVNVNGGAIAIGHPIGASGCRILSRCCTRWCVAMPRRVSPVCASAGAWAWHSQLNVEEVAHRHP